MAFVALAVGGRDGRDVKVVREGCARGWVLARVVVWRRALDGVVRESVRERVERLVRLW